MSLKQIQLRVDSFSKPLLIKSANTDIRPLLATLVWNNLAEFKNVKGSIQYRIIAKNALRYIQLPRYLFHINEIFGGKGSQIIKARLFLFQSTSHRYDQEVLVLNYKILPEVGTY